MLDKIWDKKWTKFWTKNGHIFGQKNWKNILETLGGGGRGRYASCGHAGGLSCVLSIFRLHIMSVHWIQFTTLLSGSVQHSQVAL